MKQSVNFMILKIEPVEKVNNTVIYSVNNTTYIYNQY